MLYKKLESLEDRKDLELNGPGNYRVLNNKIFTRAIEINAVRHCNLSCKSCSHSSPISRSKEYDVKIIQNDLALLSQYLHCEFVRLLGGEPLLHSNLIDVLKNNKNSNISDKICLVTNGILLDKLSDEMLNYIDKVEISLYPLNKQLLERIRLNALRLVNKGVKVILLEYSDFRESIVQNDSYNENMKQLIYETCQIAHNWRCITVDNNRIYRCPQSMIYCEKNSDYKDSIKIDTISSLGDILNYLENNNFLNSCSTCLGSVGRKFEHIQLKKENWYKELPCDIESGIDYDYAKTLVKKLEFKSDCMKRNNLN